MDRQFKRSRKTAVQLTSLLDLLFVMIFVSLLQQKEITPAPVAETKPTPIAKPKPQKVIYSIKAKFNFYSVAGNQYNGTYLMEGVYNNQSGRINLGSVKWIDKPPLDIVMVPLAGRVNQDKTSFTGKIEAKGCKEFNLKRTSFDNTNPIAGVWKGTYICAQGSTGLTLTIE